MTKNIWAGIIALVVVIACGIGEVLYLSNEYNTLHDKCGEMLALAENETITENEFDDFVEEWVELRETSELLLPHIDVYELNLRVYEAAEHIRNKDYKSAGANIAVAYQLLEYIPHLMTPNFKHIV